MKVVMTWYMTTQGEWMPSIAFRKPKGDAARSAPNHVQLLFALHHFF